MFRMTIKTKTEGYLNYEKIVAYDLVSNPDFVLVGFADKTELYYSKKDIIHIWVDSVEEEDGNESN